MTASTSAGQGPPTSASGDEKPPTNTLFMGNLPDGVSHGEVMRAFDGKEALDCLIVNGGSARTYAFVLFRHVAAARAAMDSVQGVRIGGKNVRIEFSRPAKAVSHLWVGGVSPLVSKEELEAEFSKFGNMESFRFLRERNSALVDFSQLEDAINAQRNLNRKTFGGVEICVDFERQPPRERFARGGKKHMGSNANRNRVLYDPTMHSRNVPHSGMQSQLGQSQTTQAEPTHILWVGYPPSIRIDERMLHDSMILFGEIERIMCFPTRNYSLIEFRSADEARRAKEAVEGRLFNDPRIQILYSRINFPASWEDPYPNSNLNPDPRADLFFHEGRPIRPNIPVRVPSRLPGSGLGLLPPPAGPHPIEQGDPKRRRVEAYYPSDEPRFDPRFDPRTEGYGDVSGYMNPRRSVSVERGYSEPRRTPEREYCWRGAIAKGGNLVCYARCIPVGRGIQSPLPETIDCHARADLETLAQHYHKATGSDLSYFLPDCESEFKPYTEFLDYLRINNRAMVARLASSPDSTLFLVPPSHFLSSVLKIDPGRQRLYGLVLHLPPKPPSPPPSGPVEPVSRLVGLVRVEPNDSAAQPARVSLTPELISTLAALIPGNRNSNGNSDVDGQVGVRPPPLPPLPPGAPPQLAYGNAPSGQEFRSYTLSTGQQYDPSNYTMPAGGFNLPSVQPQTPIPLQYITAATSATTQQVSQMQSAFSSVGPGPASSVSEEETKRYESTLQYAATLLQHVQQQRLQSYGLGNQQ